MKNHVSRQTYRLALVALCCVLAVALVSACVVYAAHTVEGADAHCDCPICRFFSVVGAVWTLTVALTVAFVASARGVAASGQGAHTETPALSFVKLNC